MRLALRGGTSLAVLAAGLAGACGYPHLYVYEGGADAPRADDTATDGADAATDGARVDVADGGSVDAQLPDTAGPPPSCGDRTCQRGESPCSCIADCPTPQVTTLAILPMSPWVLYPGATAGFGSPLCQVDQAGQVHLSGVATYGSGGGSDATVHPIATLGGCPAPMHSVEFDVAVIDSGGSPTRMSGTGAVVIDTSGIVHWSSAQQGGAPTVTPGSVSLDGIVYLGVGAPIATPTPLSMSALGVNWRPGSAAGFGPPSFYVDPAGEVHLTGMVMRVHTTATAVTGETILTLPSGFGPSNRITFDGVENVATVDGVRLGARIDVVDGGVVEWRSGANNGVAALTLDGITFQLASYTSGAPWTLVSIPPGSSWSDYHVTERDAGGGDSVPIGARLDCLGVAHARGRMTDSTAPVPMDAANGPLMGVLSVHPTTRRIFPALTGGMDLGGRIDVDTGGSLYWLAGDAQAGGYESLANITFVP